MVQQNSDSSKKKLNRKRIEAQERVFVMLSSLNPLINGFLDGKLAFFLLFSTQFHPKHSTIVLFGIVNENKSTLQLFLQQK